MMILLLALWITLLYAERKDPRFRRKIARIHPHFLVREVPLLILLYFAFGGTGSFFLTATIIIATLITIDRYANSAPPSQI